MSLLTVHSHVGVAGVALTLTVHLPALTPAVVALTYRPTYWAVGPGWLVRYQTWQAHSYHQN